ncbi:MAG: NADH-quinone oxidoreductase subunit C [Candidatus Eremiobacterota bacterium]
MSREFLAETVAGLKQRLGEGFAGQRDDRQELTAWVQPDRWTEAARYLKMERGFEFLSDLTAVDYLDRAPRFDVAAVFLSLTHKATLRVKTMLDESAPLDSLTLVWPCANWYEREIYDLFGIQFHHHPNLTRILLPPDYHGHPLRKDYPVTGPAGSPYR